MLKRKDAIGLVWVIFMSWIWYMDTHDFQAIDKKNFDQKIKLYFFNFYLSIQLHIVVKILWKLLKRQQPA